MGLINYIDIDWPQLLKPMPGVKTNFFNRIRVRREVIPIIFVPGIMGSRLKQSTGESVWDPDRAIMCMLIKYGGWWNTPAQRKRMLIGNSFKPEFLMVNENDRRHNKRFWRSYDPWRDKRGWGGVFWGSYGGFLDKLQNYRWEVPVRSRGEERLKELAGHCFEFPVHAFGYNWTDTNHNSGSKLAKKITAIKDEYKSKGRLCKYVILVTHSMGGLVARSACKLYGAEKNVLGIVHGVQPAMGAAAAYWRMKAGFERTGFGSTISAWVLGTNGEEVTCILGNAPGGLELLPNKLYRNNTRESAWLQVPLRGGKILALPVSDPYEEIYRVRDKYWRLINPAWLSPRDKKSPPVNPYNNNKYAWDKYNNCIKKAKKFHDDLKDYCREKTYQFYASGLNTVDGVSFSRDKVTATTVVKSVSDYSYETTVPSHDQTSRGECVMYVDEREMEIPAPLTEYHTTYGLSMSRIGDYKGGGDGTVPDSSGSSLGDKALAIRKIAGEKHSDVYGNKEVQEFTITAIRNLALIRLGEGEVKSAK